MTRALKFVAALAIPAAAGAVAVAGAGSASAATPVSGNGYVGVILDHHETVVASGGQSDQRRIRRRLDCRVSARFHLAHRSMDPGSVLMMLVVSTSLEFRELFVEVFDLLVRHLRDVVGESCPGDCAAGPGHRDRLS
ncbi:hypothetical protein [Rhodococcus erythropolis]